MALAEGRTGSPRFQAHRRITAVTIGNGTKTTSCGSVTTTDLRITVIITTWAITIQIRISLKVVKTVPRIVIIYRVQRQILRSRVLALEVAQQVVVDKLNEKEEEQ